MSKWGVYEDYRVGGSTGMERCSLGSEGMMQFKAWRS